MQGRAVYIVVHRTVVVDTVAHRTAVVDTVALVVAIAGSGRRVLEGGRGDLVLYGRPYPAFVEPPTGRGL